MHKNEYNVVLDAGLKIEIERNKIPRDRGLQGGRKVQQKRSEWDIENFPSTKFIL